MSALPTSSGGARGPGGGARIPVRPDRRDPAGSHPPSRGDRPDVVGSWHPPFPLDLPRTLAPLGRGAGDPTLRLTPTGCWRTVRTPDGPATLRLTAGDGTVHAAGWGPGAAWAVDGVPALLGEHDRPEEFRAHHPTLAEAHRRNVGVRQPCTRRPFEALVVAVLEQLVTAREAVRSFRELLRWYGDPAPGPAPAGMFVLPSAETIVALPDWVWHRMGVDGRRRRTLHGVARVADAVDRTAGLPLADARRRLGTLPGVGIWTVAEVAARALGDLDAVSVGDFHLPSVVGHALTGRPLDDAGMLEVLAPYRPFRARAVRLLTLGGAGRPRFGPRYPARDNRLR